MNWNVFAITLKIYTETFILYFSAQHFKVHAILKNAFNTAWLIEISRQNLFLEKNMNPSKIEIKAERKFRIYRYEGAKHSTEFRY